MTSLAAVWADLNSFPLSYIRTSVKMLPCFSDCEWAAAHSIDQSAARQKRGWARNMDVLRRTGYRERFPLIHPSGGCSLSAYVKKASMSIITLLRLWAYRACALQFFTSRAGWEHAGLKYPYPSWLPETKAFNHLALLDFPNVTGPNWSNSVDHFWGFVTPKKCVPLFTVPPFPMIVIFLL